MVKRRKFLIGMGSLAAGSAAAMGTGAFSSFTGERTASVPVVNDADALLGIQQTDNPNSEYFNPGDDPRGEAAIVFGDEEGLGDGFNKGMTYVDSLFQFNNMSSQKQYVWIEEEGNRGGDKAVGFYANDSSSESMYAISVADDGTDPRDHQPLKGQVPFHAIELGTGETQPVGLVVDTNALGGDLTRQAVDNGIAELLEHITVHAESEEGDLPAAMQLD